MKEIERRRFRTLQMAMEFLFDYFEQGYFPSLHEAEDGFEVCVWDEAGLVIWLLGRPMA